MVKARTPALVTKATVAKALKGVIAAGMAVDRIAGVKVTADGVVVLFGEPQAIDQVKNEWDEVLNK